MTRAEILKAAEACVTGQRVQDYGAPEDSFRMIAGLWSAYLDEQIDPIDVALMMALLKIARVQTSSGKPSNDCFVDLAGYAACAGEIAGGPNFDDE